MSKSKSKSKEDQKSFNLNSEKRSRKESNSVHLSTRQISEMIKDKHIGEGSDYKSSGSDHKERGAFDDTKQYLYNTIQPEKGEERMRVKAVDNNDFSAYKTQKFMNERWASAPKSTKS